MDCLLALARTTWIGFGQEAPRQRGLEHRPEGIAAFASLPARMTIRVVRPVGAWQACAGRRGPGKTSGSLWRRRACSSGG